MTPIKRLAVGAVTGLLLSSVSEARIAVRSEQKPLGGTTQHSASDSPFTESFARFTDDVMQDWKVPGMAIAVIDGDNIYTEVWSILLTRDSSTKSQLGFWLRHSPRCQSYARDTLLYGINKQSLH